MSLAKRAPRVLIATSSFAETSRKPLDLLTEHGIEVVKNPFGRRLTRGEVIELGNSCSGIISGLEPLDEPVLNRLPQLKCISRCGSGLENIDLERARDLGIVVKSTPEAPTQAVAELTVGLVLSLLRRISFIDRELRKGRWPKYTGELLGGKTVGILGLGRIGQASAKLFLGFGARVIGYDPVLVESITDGGRIELLSFDRILVESDILCLHASQEPGRGPLMGAAELARMKRGSYLVNTARGSLVDEGALYEALVSNRLAGAALDVFDEEPYQGPLCELDNVVLTSHVGSYAKEARERMELEAVQNLLGVLVEVNV